MVAYSFQKQFKQPIWDRTKIGTIRALRNPPSRHARSGETVQLYTGLRTKHTTLIGTATCRQTLRILIGLREGCVFYPTAMTHIADEADLNDFAISDGFKSWEKLVDFWGEHHPSVYTFQGAHILWGDTFVPAAIGA